MRNYVIEASREKIIYHFMAASNLKKVEVVELLKEVDCNYWHALSYLQNCGKFPDKKTCKLILEIGIDAVIKLEIMSNTPASLKCLTGKFKVDDKYKKYRLRYQK